VHRPTRTPARDILPTPPIEDSLPDKSERVIDKIALFNAEGWVFASIDYPLSPNPPDLSDA